VEEAHPLQGGVLRHKYWLDRRPGMPIEPIWSFYPKHAWTFAKNSFYELRLLIWLLRTVHRVYSDKNRYAYIDQTLTPVTDEETERLELFTRFRRAPAQNRTIDWGAARQPQRAHSEFSPTA
jgi:hypothetical protein